jgi:hypothetical protein
MRRSLIVGLAALAAILAAGCAKKPDDGAIATNIRSQMYSSQLLKNSDLKVNVSKGEVTLSGAVASDAARQDAFNLASQTPGVVKVVDQMSAAPLEVTEPGHPTGGLGAASSLTPAAPSRKPREEKKKETESVQTQSAQIAPAPQPAPEPAPQPPPSAQLVAVQVPTPPAPVPPPQPKQVLVPANSTLTVRMIDGVDSSVNHAGEIFHASLEVPLTVDDQIVVPRGADVYVRLSAAKSAGRIKGKSELHMEILKLEFQGRSYPVVSSTYSATGSSRGKNTAKKVGGGAAIGAIIGAIAGGGAGAAIGAGVGAGTGAVWNGVTRGEQIKIPAETMLDFQVEEPFTVTVRPRPISAAQ